MVDRYFITLGAPTTAGGKVTSGSRFETIDGAPVAVEGDTCWCPACLSEGVIRAHGPRLPDAIDGIEVALQDDLCICKCSPPPRLIASQTLMCQSVDSDWYAGQEARAATTAAQANAAALAPPEREDLPLVLVEPDMYEAILELPYRLELEGTLVEGMLDHKGWTDPLSDAERSAVVIVQADTTAA